MDAKDLHIPDTNNPEELKLFILKLRDMLINMQAENAKNKRELEGCRVLADSNTKRLDIVWKNLNNRQLYDYKIKKYFNIFE